MGSKSPGKMVLISGPSGAGKSTVVRRLLDDPRLVFSISATTRPRRAGEVDGVDYFFLSPEEFAERRARGEFLEHAEVHGHMYGTLTAQMEEALASGRIFLLEIDVQGANQIRAQRIPGLSIFIVPPDGEELRRRLVGRGTDLPEVVERRLAKAEDEARERVKYDHVVINDDLERALEEVRGLIGLEPIQEESA
ncbi:MAG: guanylate kinase [Planctomycetota bacterium]|nr:guanylate kinase [Planctomycetota bacterium]MDP6991031.1 guanylate kinase [Planctomycetota bacterium]